MSVPVLCPDLLRTLLGPRNPHTNTTNKPDPATHDPDQTSPAQTNPKPTHYQSGSHHTTRIVRSHSPLTHDIWTIPDTECAKSGKGRLFPSSFLALPWLLFPSHPTPCLSSALPSFSAALLPNHTRRRVHPWKRPGWIASPVCLFLCAAVLRQSSSLHSNSGSTAPGSTHALPLAGAVEGRIICSLASTHSLVVTYFAISARPSDPTHNLRPNAPLPPRPCLSRSCTTLAQPPRQPLRTAHLSRCPGCPAHQAVQRSTR